MNVTVFGATGGVGSQVVDQLRTRGHQVTAYVRKASKVPSSWGEDVTVVVGERSDAEAVNHAVHGADAVVSALGPSLDRKATRLPLVEGTRNIVPAMQRHGVRRYDSSLRHALEGGGDRLELDQCSRQVLNDLCGR